MGTFTRLRTENENLAERNDWNKQYMNKIVRIRL